MDCIAGSIHHDAFHNVLKIEKPPFRDADFVMALRSLTATSLSTFARLALVAAAMLALGLRHPVRAIDRASHSDVHPIDARRWEVLDIRFVVGQLAGKPDDVEFEATFTSDSGSSLKVAGFYNGQNEFLIRFTPPAVGSWRYVTRSSILDLDQKTGELNVQPEREGRRGGITIDPMESTRFVYENGESYYPIAFESDWLFALDAENESDIPVTRRFVSTLADSGFNQVVMNVFAYDVNWAKDAKLPEHFDYGSPRVFPFGGSNDQPDYSELNYDFFKRLDRVVDELDQRGIAAHLMIYVWNKRVAWPDAGSDADNRYFDHVVRRYQAFPNLVWDISKEALGYGHSDVHYITDRIERLRKKDVFKRLVTVHDYGYCRRFPANVDFVSVQLWSSELYSVMRNVREAIPGKPILNIEHGGYERGPYVVFNGNYTSPEVCLERAYQCLFAGTYPTHYWQGAAWNVIIPDVEQLSAADRPRLDYYRHMRAFVDRFQPDQLIAGEKKSNAGFCLHDGDGTFLYYVPRECDFFGLRLPKHRGKTMTTTWLDPFTGESGEPIQQEIPQWPALEVPVGDGFRLLIVEVSDE